MSDQPEPPVNKTNVTGKDVLDYFIDLVKEILDLDHGVDKWGTINEVKAKQSMSGANAWMLICSIMIASIGLNLDSEAVIIGAMLISPLMSPILGVGVAVGINDKDALYNALMHFVSAILIALITSTLYFWLTPLNEYTEQIQARTAPTFLDILIAIFGGIAGIVSIARKDISTTLPGVAIATALMPPLCVTGYGLASGSFDIASKSFYLFFLNSFFVAFATYVIVRYLRFPHKKYASPQEKRKNIIIVSLVSLIMTVPSFLIFSSVYKEFKEEQKVQSFLNKYIGDNSIFLDDYQLIKLDDGSQKLILKVYGDSISRAKLPYYQQGLKKSNMTNTTLEIIPTSEINLTKVQQIESQLSEVGNRINNQIASLQKEREERLTMFSKLENQKIILGQDSVFFREFCEGIKIFIPEIESINIAISQYSDFETIASNLPLVVAQWNNPKEGEITKLRNYIMERYEVDTVKVIVVD